MLRRLIRRVTPRQSSIQYELQRMTPQGGWKNFYTAPDGDETESFTSPPDKPEFGASAGWPPGRYRCVKRADGRIADVVWTAASPDAEEYYQQQRDRARERDRLAELSLDELLDELDDGQTFETLPREEVVQLVLDKHQAEQEPAEGYSNLERRLIESLLSEEGPSAAVSELTDIEAAKQGVCYRCASNKSVKQCDRCGDLVCRDHRHRRSDICSSCV